MQQRRPYCEAFFRPYMQVYNVYFDTHTHIYIYVYWAVPSQSEIGACSTVAPPRAYIICLFWSRRRSWRVMKLWRDRANTQILSYTCSILHETPCVKCIVRFQWGNTSGMSRGPVQKNIIDRNHGRQEAHMETPDVLVSSFHGQLLFSLSSDYAS